MCRRQRGETGLDIGNDLFGLFCTAMRDQPSRAFRYPESHKKDQAGQTGANQESEPPAKIRIDKPWIKQDQRAQRAESRPDPEAPVDDKIVPSAHACGNELLNG